MLYDLVIPAWAAGACAACWAITVLALLKARRDSALHLQMFGDADRRFELERDKRRQADALAAKLATHIERMRARSDAGRVMPGVQAEPGPEGPLGRSRAAGVKNRG